MSELSELKAQLNRIEAKVNLSLTGKDIWISSRTMVEWKLVNHIRTAQQRIKKMREQGFPIGKGNSVKFSDYNKFIKNTIK